MGFALYSGVGASVPLCSMGFTALSTAPIPLCMVGVSAMPMFCGMASDVGIMLTLLSNDMGHASLMATATQSRSVIHLGALRSNSLKSITAPHTNVADKLMLSIFKNMSVILALPHMPLPCGGARQARFWRGLFSL